MNKKHIGIVLGIVVFVFVFIFFLPGEQTLNLAEAGGIVADNTDFAFDVAFYKEDVDDMRLASLSPEDKKRLAVLKEILK